MRKALVRVFAAVACAGLLVYVAAPFLTLGALPVIVKAAWVVACACAWRWPRASLVAWLAGAPLLPIVPSLAGWPAFSLATAWLAALAIPACVRVVARPGQPTFPRAAACWLLVASASLAVVLYALSASQPRAADFLLELHRYGFQQLLTTTSQRPMLSPVLAWAVLAEGLLVLWLVLFTSPDATPDRQRWLGTAARAVALGAGLVGAWAVSQWWTRSNLLLTWVELDPYLTRVNASFTDVNALGAYLASIVPLALALATGARDRAWRVAWVGAAAVMLAGIVFTASRAAWGAAAFGSAAFAAGVLWWRLTEWSAPAYRLIARAALVSAVVGVVAVAGLSAWATTWDVRLQAQRSYTDALLHTLNLRAPADERFKGRPQLWAAAVRMIRAEPLTGVGIGRYYKVVYAWAPDREKLPRPQENAHNYFLQVGAETGWPGLLAFLALLGGGVRSSIRGLRSRAPLETRRLALALACGIVAFAMTLLTGHSLLLHEGQVTFWPLVGLAWLLGRDAAGPSVRGSARWHPLVVPLTAVVLVATLPVRFATSGRDGQGLRTTGLYQEEFLPDGRPFRWTGPTAAIEPPAAARVVMLEARFAAPFPQTLQVKYEGLLIDSVPSLDGRWLTLRYVLPPSRSRDRYRRLELTVTPSWRRDGGREVGVMLGAVDWAP